MRRISVIAPSKGCMYLKYLLWGLREQDVKPHEVVLVLKGCNIKVVEDLCRKYGLPCIIIEQISGYFTHALNIGKKEAKGDILVFTDDDAIPLQKWIKKYVELHIKYRDIAGICSRDLYLDLKNLETRPTPDDKAVIKLYRWLVKSWLKQPHPLLKKYRLGVYLSKDLDIVHGPYIPDRTCYSLPFRGVNMSFKGETLYDVNFPEHPLLKRARGNEQYVGLQLVLKGWDCIYVPNNPILHIMHQSLSRGNKKDFIKEFSIMRAMYAELIGQQS